MLDPPEGPPAVVHDAIGRSGSVYNLRPAAFSDQYPFTPHVAAPPVGAYPDREATFLLAVKEGE